MMMNMRTLTWIVKKEDNVELKHLEGDEHAKQAQVQVRQFSSCCYKSHRRVPEWVAAVFDT